MAVENAANRRATKDISFLPDELMTVYHLRLVSGLWCLIGWLWQPRIFIL